MGALNASPTSSHSHDWRCLLCQDPPPTEGLPNGAPEDGQLPTLCPTDQQVREHRMEGMEERIWGGEGWRRRAPFPFSFITCRSVNACYWSCFATSPAAPCSASPAPR